jgi:hypothetical protein
MTHVEVFFVCLSLVLVANSTYILHRAGLVLMEGIMPGQ